jgi:hypothetical protein
MLFRELYDGWKKYPRKWDKSYKASMVSGIWNAPSEHLDLKVHFLNEWLCRVDIKTAIPYLREQNSAFCNLLGELSSSNLMEHEMSDRTVRIYDVLAKVAGLGPTGISKYLHMHKPDLFIMWDNQIFKDYYHMNTVSKVTATSARYLRFHNRMREELLEALKDFSSLNGLSGICLEKFQSEFKDETIPRIIDKYNYATRGQAKRRLD